MGKLFVIEGLDGSGKSTQAEKLCEGLRKEGTDAVKIKLPDYDDPSSTLVRMYLAGEFSESADGLSPYAASMFYAVDRVASFKRHWQKVYLGGSVIIADRYTTSNAVYQLSKLPVSEWDGFLEWLWDTEYTKLELPRPDAVVFLDVPKRVIEKAIDAEIESGNLVASDIPEPDSIYPVELYRAEEGIVTEIRRLASKSLPWRLVDVDAAVSEEEEKQGLHLTHTQKDAVGAAFTSKVSVISGGPGMGKTTALKTILSILENEGSNIQLCAPSESGARRFSELTHREVKSIRKLLEYNVAEGVFKRSRKNPVECDLLVVGDSTVLDITTAHRLLAALPSSAAVLFVGDRDLLPSVGPGMFFSDLIDSQVVPVVQFNEVIHEGSASWIAKVAHQIKSGETPVFPNKVDDGNCYFMRVDDAAEIPEALKELVVKRLPQAYRLQKTRDLQVLCPMSQGGAGTEAFNASLRHDLAGHWGEFGRFGRRYEKKDKVMQAADNVLRGTFVGEVGYVTDFDLQARELYVNFDGRVVYYAFDDLDELVPGYAVTVDKARGNEFPGVIIPITTEHTVMLRRDVLYTAVTRGQKLVVLVGEPEVLEAAVKRTDDRKRRTGLVERLMRGVPEFD